MAKFNLNDNWYEIIDSESPTTSTFNNSSSSSVATFLIPNTDIIPFVQDVLGSATLKNNS